MTKTSALKNILNFVFVLLTAYTAVLLYSRWIARDARQDQNAPQITALNLNSESVQLPPKDDKPAVLVFWATWCGPCKLELDRLKKAAEKGEIPMERIFAISLGESLSAVQAESKDRGYQFPVFADEQNQSAQAFKVKVTPTLMTLNENGKIEWVAEGLHPLSTRRARQIFGN